MVPGVGIAPTFTISRAILSDAVVLVRGDRFYTVSSRSYDFESTIMIVCLLIYVDRLTTTLKT